jgi:hypothetical protein
MVHRKKSKHSKAKTILRLPDLEGVTDIPLVISTGRPKDLPLSECATCVPVLFFHLNRLKGGSLGNRPSSLSLTPRCSWMALRDRAQPVQNVPKSSQKSQAPMQGVPTTLNDFCLTPLVCRQKLVEKMALKPKREAHFPKFSQLGIRRARRPLIQRHQFQLQAGFCANAPYFAGF